MRPGSWRTTLQVSDHDAGPDPMEVLGHESALAFVRCGLGPCAERANLSWGCTQPGRALCEPLLDEEQSRVQNDE